MLGAGLASCFQSQGAAAPCCAPAQNANDFVVSPSENASQAVVPSMLVDTRGSPRDDRPRDDRWPDEKDRFERYSDERPGKRRLSKMEEETADMLSRSAASRSTSAGPPSLEQNGRQFDEHLQKVQDAFSGPNAVGQGFEQRLNSHFDHDQHRRYGQERGGHNDFQGGHPSDMHRGGDGPHGGGPHGGGPSGGSPAMHMLLGERELQFEARMRDIVAAAARDPSAGGSSLPPSRGEDQLAEMQARLEAAEARAKYYEEHSQKLTQITEASQQHGAHEKMAYLGAESRARNAEDHAGMLANRMFQMDDGYQQMTREMFQKEHEMQLMRADMAIAQAAQYPPLQDFQRNRPPDQYQEEEPGFFSCALPRKMCG